MSRYIDADAIPYVDLNSDMPQSKIRVYVAFKEKIDRLPTIDPVKHGKWIDVTNGRGGHECDQCHDYAPAWQTGKEHLTDFFPQCGARMEDE